MATKVHLTRLPLRGQLQSRKTCSYQRIVCHTEFPFNPHLIETLDKKKSDFEKALEDTFYCDIMIGGQSSRVNVELGITMVNLENG